jgi:4'-phosphopantetheinyl transferase
MFSPWSASINFSTFEQRTAVPIKAARRPLADTGRSLRRRNVAHGHVDVWVFKVDRVNADIGGCRALLSPEECQRAERYVQPVDQEHFIAGRAAIRRILAAYVDCSPREIAFDVGACGKPSIREIPAFAVNWTHSNAIWALALTRDHPIGLDIEHVAPCYAWSETASIAFHQYAFIAASPRESVARFFDVWTCKEALLKGTGKGIDNTISRISVVGPNGELSAQITGEDKHIWFVSPIRALHKYALALAASYRPRTLHFYIAEELQLHCALNIPAHLRTHFMKEGRTCPL